MKPQDETIVCTCPFGFILEGDECVSCNGGEYFSDGKCIPVPNQNVALPSLLFFSPETFEKELPTGWETACIGECIDHGLRFSAKGIELGSVDFTKRFQKTLTFTVQDKMLQTGSFLHFKAIGIESAALFSVYLDGVRAAITSGDEDTFTVALPQSTKNIVFSFTQSGVVYDNAKREESTDDNTFLLNNIRIVGVSSSSLSKYASFATTTVLSSCPGGSSIDSSSTCALCGAGTFEENGTCVPCGEGQFNPTQGQTSCLECTFGTPSEDFTTCNTNGVFTSSISEDSKAKPKTYNLTKVSDLGPLLVRPTKMLYLSLNDTKFDDSVSCTALGTHACVVNEENAEDFGSLVEFKEQTNEREEEFTLTYTTLHQQADDTCPNGRKTQIIFTCSLATASLLPVVLLSSDCDLYLQWNSVAACPVCDPDSDYEYIVGACTKGTQITQRMKKADAMCNPVLEFEDESVSCSSVEISYALVIIGTVLLAAVVVLISVFLYLHYNVSQKYNRLIEDQYDDDMM
jgi:hypothetical protein